MELLLLGKRAGDLISQFLNNLLDFHNKELVFY